MGENPIELTEAHAAPCNARETMPHAAESSLMEEARCAERKRREHGPNRVVITGVGAITPAGRGVQALWDALMAGRCALSQLPAGVRESCGVSVAGVIPGYDPLEAGFSKKEARRFAPFVQYAIIAADEALADAGIDLAREDRDRFACTFGSGIGGVHIFEEESAKLHERGPKRVNPLFIPIMISNMAAGQLAIRYGLRGECTNMVTACATGTHNIGEAFRIIRDGYADVALAGGSEESVAPMSLAGFGNLGALTKAEDPADASKPFDVNRSGFVAADGAGAVIVESLDHARARRARIYAEIVGFGSTGDGYHMTAPGPSGRGIAKAMAAALAEGGYELAEVGHVNAHGTATKANDLTEARALHLLAGEKAASIPVTSVKGCTGHMLGGAGAVEAIVTALSLVNNVVPPTVGCTQVDPECAVNVVRSPLRTGRQRVAVSNSLGFGGHNASLALVPFDEEREA